MALVTRSNHELDGHLKDQKKFLLNSADLYDSGETAEAVRLATTIRVLVHDSINSRSLLTLCGTKSILKFADTTFPFYEENLSTHWGAVQLIMTPNGGGAQPLLDDMQKVRRVPFESWWNGVVLVDSHRNEFSRKDIVLFLCNKEGGAHVDEEVDEKLYNLKNGDTINWRRSNGDDKSTSVEGFLFATSRQIAHEVLKTLDLGYSKRHKFDFQHVRWANVVLNAGDTTIDTYGFNLCKNRPMVGGKKIGRNDICVCGSGKPYGECCII